MPGRTRIVPRRSEVRGRVQLFASGVDESSARRPTDVVLAVVSAILLVITGTLADLASEFETSLADLLTQLPGFFDLLWWMGFWAPVVWTAVLVLASLLRGRATLAAQLLLATTGALLVAAGLSALLDNGHRSVVDVLTDLDGPPAFPPGALVAAAAVVVTASPHLARPFRYLGRWLLVAQVIATTLLGLAGPSGAVAAVTVGMLAAALVHLAFGSPGGRPTTSRIALALESLGVEVSEVSPASMQSAGVVRFDTMSPGGPLLVKVYGRDAWDAQLLANLWRVAWYRGVGRTARLSRIELVEHEAFVTLLAERAGVGVAEIVTAGSAGQGDALVVVKRVGTALAAAPLPGDDVDTRSLWVQLNLLHDAAIVHGHIDLDRVVLSEDGTLAFGDLSTASVVGDETDRRTDRAQALVLALVLVGEERALAECQAAIGPEAAAELVPYVQSAAMAPLVRRELADQDIDVDDLRKRVAAGLGIEDGPIIKLRRVSVGSLVNLGLLTVAAYALISVFGDLDFATLVDALADAKWSWLVFALLVAQIARVPAAVSTMGSTPVSIPLGPLTTLQFAICYVNLAIPSTVARVAINVRFFERFGIPGAAAMSAGVIDSVSGFVVQIAIFCTLFFASDVDLGLSTDTSTLSGLGTVVLIALGVLVVAILVIAAVPSVRAKVVGWWNEARTAMRVLRSPHKLLQLFGGNLVSQVLFAIGLSASVQAFGYSPSLTSLLLINTVVSLFAGLLPVPGGIGVSEAGITMGLTRIGLPAEEAFAAALSYRLVSFYLPPIWGWFCYQWLVRERFL